MKKAFMYLAGLLLSTSVLFGQQAGPSFGVAGMEASSVSGTEQAVTVLTCPVKLAAKQGGMSDLIRVRRAPESPAQTPARPGQRIHLIVTNPDGASVSKIVGATVTARGLSARARVDKASGSHGPAGLRRTLNVTFAPAGDHSLSTELVLPGFTAVTSIKVEALEYADGSTRDLSVQKLCVVQPDPFMLVAER